MRDSRTRESLLAQTAKNLPAIQERRSRSLGGEDPLEEEMATHSNLLAWEIPWTEEPGGLQSMGSQRVSGLSTHTLYPLYRVVTFTSHLFCR